MKLIVDAETDKVLGASMCGPDAPEIMQVYYTFIDLFVCLLLLLFSHEIESFTKVAHDIMVSWMCF